jgi:hypothetical protein
VRRKREICFTEKFIPSLAVEMSMGYDDDEKKQIYLVHGRRDVDGLRRRRKERKVETKKRNFCEEKVEILRYVFKESLTIRPGQNKKKMFRQPKRGK